MPVKHMLIIAFWSEYRSYNRETAPAFGSAGLKGKARYDQLTGMFFRVKQRSLGTWSREILKPSGDKRGLITVIPEKCRMSLVACL